MAHDIVTPDLGEINSCINILHPEHVKALIFVEPVLKPLSNIEELMEGHEALRLFWRETSKICLADLNGYPVLSYLSERKSVYDARKVLKHYTVGIEERKRGRIYGSRAKISDMRLVQESSRALGENLHEVTFLILDNKSELILEGRLYLQDFLFKFFRKDTVALTLPIAEGLNLVAHTKS